MAKQELLFNSTDMLLLLAEVYQLFTIKSYGKETYEINSYFCWQLISLNVSKQIENSEAAPPSFVCAAQGVTLGHVPWITVIHT